MPGMAATHHDPQNRPGWPTPSRAAAFADARQHSRRVRLLKTGLPLAALALAALFAAWSWSFGYGDAVAINLDSAALSDGKLVMANPRLAGLSADNEPYTMTALRAVQDPATPSVIALEAIDADLPFGGGQRARVVAGSGIVDRGSGTMTIPVPVTVTTSDDMVMRLADARVDMKAGALVTDSPVDIETPRGHITADSMRVADRGRKVVFEKRVRLIVVPEKFKEAPAGGADAAQ